MNKLNPICEQVARKLADALPNKAKAQIIYNAFINDHPNLKKWEALTIVDRARHLYKLRTS